MCLVRYQHATCNLVAHTYVSKRDNASARVWMLLDAGNSTVAGDPVEMPANIPNRIDFFRITEHHSFVVRILVWLFSFFHRPCLIRPWVHVVLPQVHTL
jgi:hypothetical protein